MKVKSYKSLAGFIRNTEDFLIEKEVTNNLFWEVLRGLEKQPGPNYWAGNIMKNGKIEMSAILTSSNYLLISKGNKAALNHLKNGVLEVLQDQMNIVQALPING